MLLTNIDVNNACTTERGNRYLPVVSKDLCPYYHNYNATNYVTSSVTQIAQWSKLLTSTRFFKVMSSNLRRVLFIYLYFFVVVGFLFFLFFFPNQVCTLCMILEFLGILMWETIFLQKMHAVNSLSFRLSDCHNGKIIGRFRKWDEKLFIIRMIQRKLFYKFLRLSFFSRC